MYTTTENDTLFGLALKLDIREHDIQELNGIGESIYPGMVHLFIIIKDDKTATILRRV